MTYLLSIDPGLASGIALGRYDAITPYTLIYRWQVLDGLEGFLAWWDNTEVEFDEIVVEKFILDPKNKFAADLTPVEIEGCIQTLLRDENMPITWQPRTDKATLTGYPPEAKTKAQRQRVRFDFLKRFGMFEPGTQNDDSNDAVTHALIYLKRAKHYPTLMKHWPMKAVA